ncbi:hypothetical protein HII31_03499 [Pseudocercospora fuligena]|uniref:Uncharacterized protein n=1 Tax=Pseudocercospora fuligena TaxID=685502 RepID=A0A8H6RQX9_9PEZI|nr:hypothetical protein HII31_03499 [Pseudocercospora fuligena]
MDDLKKTERTASLQRLVDQAAFKQTHSRGNKRILTHQYELTAKKHAKVAARNRTINYPFAIRPDLNASGLGTEMFNRMVDRVKASGVPISRISRAEFAYMLPNDKNTAGQLKIFDAFFHSPMTITNAELGAVIKLKRCTADSGPAPVGSHIYSRSWIFTAKELREVIAEMPQYSEAQEWKRTVDLFAPKVDDSDLSYETEIDGEDPLTLPTAMQLSVNTSNVKSIVQQAQNSKMPFFTVRYIGAVESTLAVPRSPWDRHMEDLNHRKAGVFMEFQTVIERLYPHIADAVEVHLIEDASLSIDPDEELSRSNLDRRERCTVEFFDHATLLNRQHGGIFAEFVPNEVDVDIFDKLDVRFYFRYQKNAYLPDQEARSSIMDRFRRLQVFANSNAATGTSRHYFADKLRDGIARESMPYRYRGEAPILAIVGKDITLSQYVGGLGFFEAKSRAATLTFEIIHGLASREKEFTQGEQSWSSLSFQTELFPFVDLWTWLWHNCEPEAREFLREYVATSQPLITASLSKEVNNVTRANFVHNTGVKSKQFIDDLGLPTIQFSDSNTTTTQYDENSAFINVPHWHPGADKYTSYQQEVRRVLNLTWQATQLYGSMMMDIVDSFLDKNEPLPSRQKLCEIFMERYNQAQTDDTSKEFFSNFTEAKRDLRDKHVALNSRKRIDDERPVLDRPGRLRMAALGQALDEPNSKHRIQQVQHYWDLNIPDLHLTIPHEDLRKEEWMQQFLNLRQGQYFFIQVLTTVPVDDYVKHLVRAILPEWKDEEWMNSSEKKTEALLACGVFFQKSDKDDERVRALKRYYPDQWASAYDIQSRLVGVANNGEIRIRWQRDDGTKVSVKVRSKRAIPEEGERLALRTIHFTEHGIDILNAKNEPFRRFYNNTGKYDEATFPKATLPGNIGGPVVMELWKAVCQAHGIDISEEPEFVPEVWACQPGVTGIGKNATTEKPLQNRPPKEGDALYPLQAWLDERFPNGGTLHTISAERLPDSTEDLQHFVGFLKSQKWLKHPHVESFWLPKLEQLTPDGTTLEKNIRILRGTAIKKRQQRKSGPGANVQVKETYYIVGPPGSASDNPFPPKAPKAGGKTAAKNNDDGDSDSDDDDKPVKKGKGKAKKGGDTKQTLGKHRRDQDDEDDDFGEGPSKPSSKAPTKRKRAAAKPRTITQTPMSEFDGADDRADTAGNDEENDDEELLEDAEMAMDES